MRFLGSGLVAALLLTGCATGAETERDAFGTLDDGTAVESVLLTTDSGYEARVIALGAILQSLVVPDGSGEAVDVVLGFDEPQGYLDNPSYLGATVGRFANRIGGASFDLGGETYALEANENGNILHGGPDGWDKRVWTIAEASGDEDGAFVTLTLTSPDGDQGFPGEVEATVTYALGEDGTLTITHEAVTDTPTVVNMTNHSYFNLSGATAMSGIADHELTIPASRITPVADDLIPTGELADVSGTPFDFRQAKPIREGLRDASDPQIRIGSGFDHNFVLDEEASGAPRLAARLRDPASGRVMEVLTDQPAIQFYSGNFLDGSAVGKGETFYRQGDALCLEPQVHPDAPNKEGFPSATLEPGATYRHVMVLRFSNEAGE